MRRILRQLGHDTAYVLVGFPLAVIFFVLVITGFSLGAGLLITLLGLPVLAATAYLARGAAEVERVRMGPILNAERVRVNYRTRGERGWRRLLTPLADIQSWLDMLHTIVRFPISTFGFVLIVTWWSVALAGLAYPLYYWALPEDVHGNLFVVDDQGLHDVFGIENRFLVYFLVGLIFTLTLPAVLRACALLEAWVAHAMLNGVAGLRDQVGVARAQTAAAVEAEATALKRLERDIHDGPQQRLVRLAVDLGRARSQLDSDPEAARQTVDEALAQTREALEELRTLSRGIAPPILTDRGLVAAVQSLAGRATVPVELDLAAPAGLSALVEQTAYFTVAEALTNIAKHAHATRAAVTIKLENGRLVVTVTDDGTGGAHVAKGHGLAGLADRLRVAGGWLVVDSPPGGPTRVEAEIPCA